jgi:hypothetical protein
MHAMSKREHIPAPGELAEEPLRRRVIFELRPSELPLLAAAERRHGTKRAALVVALEAEGRREALERTLAEAQAQVERLERELAAEQAAHAKAAKALESAASSSRTRAKKEAAAQAGEWEQRSRQAAKEIRTLERLVVERTQALEALEAEQITHLFCARCGVWTDEREWSWEEDGEGEYAYHRPCGDHGPGMLGASSRLGWRPS